MVGFGGPSYRCNQEAWRPSDQKGWQRERKYWCSRVSLEWPLVWEVSKHNKAGVIAADHEHNTCVPLWIDHTSGFLKYAHSNEQVRIYIFIIGESDTKCASLKKPFFRLSELVDTLILRYRVEDISGLHCRQLDRLLSNALRAAVFTTSCPVESTG